MKEGRILAGKFAVLLTVVFIGHAFTFALMIPYLTDLGFNAEQRGWIFSLGAVATIIGQFLFGYLCDKFKTDKYMFMIVSALFAITNWLFYTASGSSVALIILWATLVTALFRITQGTLDSWVIESDKYCLENYGAIRAFGAVGWAIGSPLTAILLDKWGYVSLGTSFLIATLVTLAIAFFMKDAVKVQASKKVVLGDIKQLVFNRGFIILTLVFLFLNIAGNADIYTTIDKMISLGATDMQISFKWSFQAMCELPLFFLGGWFVKKFGSIKIVAFATVMALVRYVLYALATTPDQLIWVSGFQMVTFPFIMIGSKLLIDEVSPDYLRASGQQISSAIYIGVAMLITPVACGFLVEKFSYDFALYVVAASLVIPLLLLVVYQKTKKDKEVIV